MLEGRTLLSAPGGAITPILIGNPGGNYEHGDPGSGTLTLPELAITYLSTRTFIISDTIVLKASFRNPSNGVGQSGAQVMWTVKGEGAAAGIGGLPKNEVTKTDSTGTATFTFKPFNDQTLVENRHAKWTKGSSSPNPAMTFDVTAKVVSGTQVFQDSLSDTDLGPLTQDETDILREEYYDYKIPVPSRDDVVASLGAQYNTGNYTVQLSDDLPGLYADVLAAYHGQRVTEMFSGHPYQTTIPDNAPVTISSGYRDPQHNKAIGSIVPYSQHTRGRALDLVPGPVQVQIVVNGRRGQPPRAMMVPLRLHETLYPALLRAGLSVGHALAENSATPVSVTSPLANHIHVNWAG
jgi:hypothetical protein